MKLEIFFDKTFVIVWLFFTFMLKFSALHWKLDDVLKICFSSDTPKMIPWSLPHKKLSNSILPRPTQNFLIQILNLAQFQLFCTKNAEKIASSRGILDHSGSEKLKKSRPKKLVKSNKSILPKNFFDQIQFFAISKMARNQFLNWKKV